MSTSTDADKRPRAITNIELIEYLATRPADEIVVLSSDVEGTKFSPLAYMETAPYEPSTDSSGVTYLTRSEVQDRIDDGEIGWTEEDFPPPGLDDVTVLWPMV